MTDMESIELMNKLFWVMEGIKFKVQKEENLKNVNRSVMVYQNSQGSVMKRCE